MMSPNLADSTKKTVKVMYDENFQVHGNCVLNAMYIVTNKIKVQELPAVHRKKPVGGCSIRAS